MLNGMLLAPRRRVTVDPKPLRNYSGIHVETTPEMKWQRDLMNAKFQDIISYARENGINHINFVWSDND